MSALRSMALLLVPAVLLCGTMSANAAPAAPPGGEQLLLGLLGDWERPVSAELLQVVSARIGGDAALTARLRTLAADATRVRYLRLRAAGALAFYPTAVNRTALEQLARGAGDVEVRGAAVRAVGHGWWRTDRVAVEGWLRTLVAGPDAALVEAARGTLTALTGPAQR